MHQVRIINEGPLCHQVFVDGQDVSRGLSGLTLRMHKGELPQLELDLRLIDVTEIGSVEADVLLGSGVADTLIKLGWTPPPIKTPPDDRT